MFCIDSVIDIGVDKFRVKALEGDGPKYGLFPRESLQIIRDTIIRDDIIVQVDTVNFECKDRFESSLVVLPIGSAESDHNVD